MKEEFTKELQALVEKHDLIKVGSSFLFVVGQHYPEDDRLEISSANVGDSRISILSLARHIESEIGLLNLMSEFDNPVKALQDLVNLLSLMNKTPEEMAQISEVN